MIKINLSNTKKALDVSNVGGFDFTKVKIKAVLIVIILIYIPDFVLIPVWEEERTTLSSEMDAKRSKFSSLKRKVNQSKDMEKQIRELKVQEENLGKKLVAVKQAISVKRNPSSLLLYIAKNIPPEVWINELDINLDTMIIKGEAFDYTSIGSFVNSLKSSVFISDANITYTNNSVKGTEKRRIESFEVVFKVTGFDQ